MTEDPYTFARKQKAILLFELSDILQEAEEARCLPAVMLAQSMLRKVHDIEQLTPENMDALLKEFRDLRHKIEQTPD